MMGAQQRVSRVRRLLVAGWGLLAGAAAVFFGIYGAVLVHAAFTFSGEGSLGHVGMYIAAFLFPLLFLFFAGAAWLAWRRFRTLLPAKG